MVVFSKVGWFSPTSPYVQLSCSLIDGQYCQYSIHYKVHIYVEKGAEGKILFKNYFNFKTRKKIVSGKKIADDEVRTL